MLVILSSLLLLFLSCAGMVGHLFCLVKNENKNGGMKVSCTIYQYITNYFQLDCIWIKFLIKVLATTYISMKIWMTRWIQNCQKYDWLNINHIVTWNCNKIAVMFYILFDIFTTTLYHCFIIIKLLQFLELWYFTNTTTFCLHVSEMVKKKKTKTIEPAKLWWQNGKKRFNF